MKNKITLSITLPKKVLGDLRKLSIATDISVSQLIEMVIRARPAYDALKNAVNRQ